MKFFEILFIAIFLLGAPAAYGQWVPAEIRNIIINSTSGGVVIQTVDPVRNNDCGNPDNDTIRNLSITTGNARFEELFARMLIAEANGERIEILATSGTCSSNGTTLTNGLYRFGLLD